MRRKSGPSATIRQGANESYTMVDSTGLTLDEVVEQILGAVARGRD